MRTLSEHEPVCITCSDQAVKARIMELKGDGTAMADTGPAAEEISVELIDASVGDMVLVHAGVAIARLGELPPTTDAPRD